MAAVVLTATVAPGALAAHAEEVSPRPANGILTLDGRGYGHGRGMSQWGAYGAADAGLDWRSILDFYYPGAKSGTLPDPSMRVWISRDNDGAATFPAQNGLSLTVGRARRNLPSGPNYTAWRVVGGSALALQHRDSAGGWKPYSVGIVGPRTAMVFAAPAGRVRVTMPTGIVDEFTGSISVFPSSGKAITVLNTTMEAYLRGVVPSEMPTSWHAQALAAQSVAARTYAASYRARKRGAGAVWDICDTITCQVYKPAASYRGATRTQHDNARSDEAIRATRGSVLRTASGGFVHAEFSASNGGHTVDGGAFSQVAKPDPYDGRMANTVHTWSKQVNVATLEKKFGLGTLQRVRVLSRDGFGPLGGRVGRVRLEGTAGAKELTGEQARSSLGLRSDWFALASVGGASGSQRPGQAAQPGPTVPRAPSVVAGADSVRVNWIGDRNTDTLALRLGRLTVARGLPGGNSAPPVPVVGSPSGLARLLGSADVSGNRRLDVVAVSSTGRMIVMKGAAGGRIVGVNTLGRGWTRMKAVRLVDLTGDGRADLLVRDAAGRSWVYPGTAASGFGARFAATKAHVAMLR